MTMLFRSLCLAALLCLMTAVAFTGNRSTSPLGVAVSPQTLILNTDQGGSVTVHTDIPYSWVATNTLALNGVAVSSTTADDRGCLVAFFPERAAKNIVAPPSAVLTLTGAYRDGTLFAGSDTVTVTVRKR